MVKKSLTHKYTDFLYNEVIAIGTFFSNTAKRMELFDKALPLTSDLKRLPYLLGGRINISFDGKIMADLTATAQGGLQIIAALLNGTFSDADINGFDTIEEFLNSDRVMDNMIMHTWGIIYGSVQQGIINIGDSHHDFEGEVVLYDTITLVLLVETGVNVGSFDFSEKNIITTFDLEIDWVEKSVKDIQEFIMEHIYARQGDS